MPSNQPHLILLLILQRLTNQLFFLFLHLYHRCFALLSLHYENLSKMAFLQKLKAPKWAMLVQNMPLGPPASPRCFKCVRNFLCFHSFMFWWCTKTHVPHNMIRRTTLYYIFFNGEHWRTGPKANVASLTHSRISWLLLLLDGGSSHNAVKGNAALRCNTSLVQTTAPGQSWITL